MKAHHALITDLLFDERVKILEVYDGEETDLFHWPFDLKQIIAATEAVEISYLTAYRNDGSPLGGFTIIPFGVEDNETVADLGTAPFCEQHWKQLEERGVV